MGGFDANDKKYLEKSGRIALEAAMNIRTVKQLNLESYFTKQYNDVIEEAFKKNSKKSLTTGVLFGLSMGVIFFAFAAGYYAAANFIRQGRMTTEDMMIVLGGMLFASMALGQNQAMAPEHGKSQAAARKIHKILSQEPGMNSSSDEGIVPEEFYGKYEFRDVSFKYPTRDTITVVRNVSMVIESGLDVAIVGPSGSGKSTMLQLLERYYDPLQGEILLDDVNLKDLNIQWYRRQLGFVGQEPILFDWSIADNIAFGNTDRDDVKIEEIRTAARSCNVDEFVCRLPQGYDTRVGSKGSLLSGGQKQRICIARSLIRNPKLLLLDEATSALDAESEQLVQKAIEVAQRERGSVTVAHNLRTIENSDSIHVMSHGRLIETGKHDELVKAQGLYADLYNLSAR
ncbi:hypothetical protein ACOME3_005843 [Neoechinorhynchus agilis]